MKTCERGSGKFDLIVVGGGHAGCEAAAAAARMGARVCLLTQSRSTIAEMPCNPAIGGIGKGHLVHEIDALGGIQGWAADRAGIQFRLLNASRGPAVWGPRAQCDKQRYSEIVRRLMEGLIGITVITGEVVGLMTEDRVCGVRLNDGRRIIGDATVLTTGTFLGAVLHTGNERTEGGRAGEKASIGLGQELKNLGLKLRRFKTGTPPRLDRESLNYSLFDVQPGDESPKAFSFRTESVENEISCWMTRTSETVQRIIEDNLDRSPLFSGVIEGVGPRYCPSIEDKVVRFPHHREHTVFIEPEGLDTRSVYVNGLSTSLPEDVQEAVIHAIRGMENARFLRYGYAVEYDVVAPGQVGRDLEVREIPGLYCAGQILGTSGYEEAAALGLMAGINAVKRLQGEKELVLGRDEAYIGVMVDDLVRMDHREPYRMFTSRAEHRLLLGIDSARERLLGFGSELGLVSERVFHVEQDRWNRRSSVLETLRDSPVNPTKEANEHLQERVGIVLSSPTTWARIMTRADVDWRRLVESVPELDTLSSDDQEIVIGRLRYEGYRSRAERERERMQRLRLVRFPEGLVFSEIPGLSREVVEQLAAVKPTNLAEAETMPGMTPAALAILAGRLSSWGNES